MKILRVIQIGLLPAAIVLESVLILASRNSSRSNFFLELFTMFVFRSGLLSTLVLTVISVILLLREKHWYDILSSVVFLALFAYCLFGILRYLKVYA